MSNAKILLIVNPCSGKAKMQTELLKTVQILSEADYDVTVYPTKSRGDATERVKKLKNKEYDIIAVAGGDGTLNEVITGMLLSGIDCPIGYIPSGTLNEWSTGLKISKNMATAASDIVRGREIFLDVGKFSDKYFAYTASFGAFTSASYSTPQDVKNVLGQAAYFFEGIKSLAAIKPFHMKFVCDKYETEGDYLFGAISNSMSVGGIVKFTEDAVSLNDGEFEVLLIKKPENLMVLQNIIDGILKQDLNREGMEFFHTKSIKVYGGSGVSWTLDGEYAEGAEEIEVTNIHNAIKFLLP